MAAGTWPSGIVARTVSSRRRTSLNRWVLIKHKNSSLPFSIKKSHNLKPSRTHVTSVQFEPDGDVITADGDGFITVYSVDSDGAYFVRMEFEAHNKGISCLVMLSEGTLLSGGEKDRKIAAWDSLQNYKRITDIKVSRSNWIFQREVCYNFLFRSASRISWWSSYNISPATRA